MWIRKEAGKGWAMQPEWETVWLEMDVRTVPTIDIVKWPDEDGLFLVAEPLRKDQRLAGPFPDLASAKLAWAVMVAEQ